MANFSPNTEAVMQAFLKAPVYLIPSGHVALGEMDRNAIAAVLRTAAEQVCAEPEGAPYGEYDKGFRDALEWTHKHFLAIAYELEGPE